MVRIQSTMASFPNSRLCHSFSCSCTAVWDCKGWPCFASWCARCPWECRSCWSGRVAAAGCADWRRCYIVWAGRRWSPERWTCETRRSSSTRCTTTTMMMTKRRRKKRLPTDWDGWNCSAVGSCWSTRPNCSFAWWIGRNSRFGERSSFARAVRGNCLDPLLLMIVEEANDEREWVCV